MNAQSLVQRIESMPPDTYLVIGEYTVARLTQTTFAVLKGGAIVRFGHSRARVNLLCVRVVEYVTGEQVTPRCARCNTAPREHFSYCRACWVKVVTEHQHKDRTDAA